MVDDLAITKSDGLAWSLSLLKPIEFSKRLQLKRAIANRDIDMAELGLSIKVPLWNNRSSRTEIERIRLKQAQASLEMTRREVAADLMNALQTYSLRMPSMKMWRDGAILVIVVLLTLLGNWKAALIVAAAIPLSFLFAITGMVHYGISGNLMSLGAEFVPTLDEGSFTAMVYQPASTSLKTSLKRARRTEAYLTTKIPEVTRTFSRIGTSEVATDPMSPGEYDLYIFYKPQSEWRKENGKTITKERLVELISNELSEEVPEQTYFFAQPIEMRFNEMLEGIRSDIAVKVFGEDIDQMESVAKERGISYLRMDGRTPVAKRKDIVNTFQSGNGPSFFFISLKTGGVGLNLTRANYVFHLDPWWNPAVENQASDRAHRIGQTRSVFVQRLIMQHSIEARMLELKARKAELFRQLVEEPGAKAAKAGLSRDDFDYLLNG